MAVLRTPTPKLKTDSDPKPKEQKKKIADPLSKLFLPAEYTEPSKNFFDYSWLIYGERKIGKSSLFSMFDKHFFLFFEKGGLGIRTRRQYVNNWEEFVKYIDLLEANPGYAKMVVIDTGGECYEQCLLQAKTDLQLEDIRDKAWGGGYTEVRHRFSEQHKRLFNITGFGVTAHAEVKEITPKFGAPYHKISIQLSSQAFKYYAGVIDTIGYMHYDDNGKRILTIRGDETVEAGTRCEGHFMYPDGTPIKDIPMGNNKEQAFNNLFKAFHNELPKPKESQHSKTFTAKKKPNS